MQTCGDHAGLPERKTPELPSIPGGVKARLQRPRRSTITTPAAGVLVMPPTRRQTHQYAIDLLCGALRQLANPSHTAKTTHRNDSRLQLYYKNSTSSSTNKPGKNNEQQVGTHTTVIIIAHPLVPRIWQHLQKKYYKVLSFSVAQAIDIRIDSSSISRRALAASKLL